MKSTLSLVMLCLACLCALDISAQTVDRRLTVSEREREEFDAIGVRVGGLSLFPQVGVEYRQDSNIYALDENELDDLILLVKPSLILESDWSRHALQIGTRADIARNDEYQGEDFEDVYIWADGRLDLNRQQLAGRIETADLHEERTDPNNQRGITPTLYTNNNLSASYTFQPAQFFFKVDTFIRDLDYEDTQTLTEPINNNERNERLIYSGLRFGYDVSNTYSLFVEARSIQNDFDQMIDSGGFQRSSQGHEGLIGATIDFPGTTYGEIYIGYRDVEYDDPRFSAVDGLTFDLDFTWNVTGLTSIELGGGNQIDSTAIVGVSGIESTNLDLEVEHELRRNLILRFAASYLNEKFQGTTRNDDVRTVGFNAEYMFNRRVSMFFGYEVEDRDTSSTEFGGFVYEKKVLMIRLEGQI